MTAFRARIAALDTAGVMRLGMLLLAVAAALVTAAELIFLAHWNGTLQLLPWVALLAVTVGIVLLVARSGRLAIWLARTLGAFALVMGGVGVLVHVISNYDAGVLDFHYTATWPTMGELGRWWLAATGGVGPTPPLAPASLSFAALLLLLASIGVQVRETARSTVPEAMGASGLDEASTR